MKTNRCKTCGKDTLRGWDYCSGCQRIKKASEDNRPVGYDTPSQPHHTPTPIDIVKSCSASGAFNEGSLLRYLDSAHVDKEAKLELAAFIVRAVNAFEDMKKALWACQVFLIDDEIFAQTKELRTTVEKALAKAEGK